MARIEPLSPPYPPETGQLLSDMMPAGVEPIALFRTFARNLPMATAMRAWGSYVLSKQLSLSRRDREIVIGRTCARCGCEYEWGVHTTYFAERAGLSKAQVRSLVYGDAADACWESRRDSLLVSAVDALHETSTVDDALWGRLSTEFSDAEILDLLLLCGWYHAISFAANGARVDLEPGAARFADVG